MLATLVTALLGSTPLPEGWSPDPVAIPHFPDRLHAYVWRNWPLAPLDRMARVVDASPEDIHTIGESMGLGEPPAVSESQVSRSYVTVLRRNWHLLPYGQLAALLGWTEEQVYFALVEGDGLFWWFGSHKPRVEPLRYAAPSPDAKARAAEIGALMREAFPNGVTRPRDPLFSFIDRLSDPPDPTEPDDRPNAFAPRFCFSYYAAFRSPLDEGHNPYPDAYLARLAAHGADGVWLHEPLFRMAPFPWEPVMSAGYEERLARLADLVKRADAHGLKVYLYINEPRPMPIGFFEDHPELKGVEDRQVHPGEVATMCSSLPEVQGYLRDSIATVCKAAPGLGGMFTITASENYTNCWSHWHGEECPRCGPRGPEAVIAELHHVIADGIRAAGADCRLIAWDWGWRNEWAQDIIERLPKGTYLQSVSEWDLPIERGGVATTVGEYSLSAIGPGPRALRHWGWARERGLRTMAKIQMSNSWEFAAVPYVPVVANVARHAVRLRETKVDGLMLSWTLGGYPSPSFDAVAEAGRLPVDSGTEDERVERVLLAVAERRFGADLAPIVADAWRSFSEAYTEYPFHNGMLYNAPHLMGPANPLYPELCGRRNRAVTAFAYPFDAVDVWRAGYPVETFARQFDKVAQGFEGTVAELRTRVAESAANEEQRDAVSDEVRMAEVCAIHFRSVANQVRFVTLRNALGETKNADVRTASIEALERIVHNERTLARRLQRLQSEDSRIGFEAACHYLYVGVDLAEKVVNCDYLLRHWLPTLRQKVQ